MQRRENKQPGEKNPEEKAGGTQPSSSASSSPQELLQEALAYAGLGSQYGELVREYVSRPDPSWRQCCSGGCVPCVDQIGRAVDYLRDLGFGGEASP